MKRIIYLSFFVFFVGFSQDKKIDSVSILGFKRTKESFLLKMVAAKTTINIDSTKFNNHLTRLKRLPGIAHAVYELKKNELTGNYQLVYHIEESFTLIPSLAIWTSANDEFSYRLGLYDFNLIGRNIAFGGTYQYNGFNSYGINFRAPYLFTNKFGLTVNFQDWKSEEPLYFSSDSANYLYNNTSIEVLGLYEPNLFHKFHLGGSFFNEKYLHLDGGVPNEVPKKLDIDKWLFKLVYDFDKLKYHYQYVDGFRSLFIGQIVTSTNEFQDEFVIGWNDFYYYKRIANKGNWANRLRVGFSSNNESPFAPFALDNNVNIRGVGNVIDRGTGSVVLNSEFRYTLVDKNWFVLQSNTFVDFGTWRTPGGDLEDFTDSDNIRVYPGLGLRFMHKKIFNAIFRIDYGYGVTKDSNHGLVFGIGQYF